MLLSGYNFVRLILTSIDHHLSSIRPAKLTSFAVIDLTNGPNRTMMRDVVRGILKALQNHGVEDIGGISENAIDTLTVQRDPSTSQHELGELEVRKGALLFNGYMSFLKTTTHSTRFLITDI